MTETWLPFAVRRDGPADKQGYATTPTRSPPSIHGVVYHSMEGYRAGAYSVLDGPKRSSWTFSVYQDDAPEQHYPLESVTWHAGTMDGNILYVGIEHEGVKGEPLTDWQYAQTNKIVKNLMLLCPNIVPERRVGLWEHREVGLTSCPNNRIDWSRIKLTQEEHMGLDPVQDQRMKDIQFDANRGLRWIQGDTPFGRAVKGDDGSPQVWLLKMVGTSTLSLRKHHITTTDLVVLIAGKDFTELEEVPAAALAAIPTGNPIK
jgi:hypothetical protein